jgi:hypothetical protein
MQYVEDVATSKGYRIIHGWCEGTKVPYYATMGWSPETSRTSTIVNAAKHICISTIGRFSFADKKELFKN